jgi:hypothetical protein
MFVGHLAVGLVSKRLAPKASLIWFFVAVNLVDLIWPILLLADVEHTRVVPGATAFTPFIFDWYPWTHSLLMGVAWATALAAVARVADVSARAAWIIAAGVLSHWVLDFVTHAPDLTLWPGADHGYGLGLWNSIPATFVIEGTMWIAAITLYLRARRPDGWQGGLALWSFIVVSTVLWASGPFSPPPPDERSLAWAAMVGWVVVPWAWWIDRTSSDRGAFRDG